jgi:hypothetical protein
VAKANRTQAEVGGNAKKTRPESEPRGEVERVRKRALPARRERVGEWEATAGKWKEREWEATAKELEERATRSEAARVTAVRWPEMVLGGEPVVVAAEVVGKRPLERERCECESECVLSE